MSNSIIALERQYVESIEHELLVENNIYSSSELFVILLVLIKMIWFIHKFTFLKNALKCSPSNFIFHWSLEASDAQHSPAKRHVAKRKRIGECVKTRHMPKHSKAWQSGNETGKMIRSSGDQNKARSCPRRPRVSSPSRETSAVWVPVTKARLTFKTGHDQALITRCSRAGEEMFTCYWRDAHVRVRKCSRAINVSSGNFLRI